MSGLLAVTTDIEEFAQGGVNVAFAAVVIEPWFGFSLSRCSLWSSAARQCPLFKWFRKANDQRLPAPGYQASRREARCSSTTEWAGSREMGGL